MATDRTAKVVPEALVETISWNEMNVALLDYTVETVG
jgi:hypothetical protein